MRLADRSCELLDDMHFGRDLGPFIDKYLKLMYLKGNLGTTGGN